MKKVESLLSCPEQSYSNIALTKFFGSAVEVNYHNTINSIFDDVNHGNVEFGVVPIENSNQGSIKLTVDHLIQEDIKICGEVNLTIKHCLLSSSKNISNVKKIYAHEQTFLQCNEWLTRNIPNAKEYSALVIQLLLKKYKILLIQQQLLVRVVRLYIKFLF